MSLIREIREDENYVKFTKILANTRAKMDLEKAMQEVLSLHMSRTSRNMLGPDRYSPKKIIDASMKDMSNRARLVEIRVRNDVNLSHLREAMDALRRYISTEYADDLKEWSTAEQRRAFVDRMMKSANQLINEGDALIKTIDTFVKDLDQSGYAFKGIISCLELLNGNKGGHIL